MLISTLSIRVRLAWNLCGNSGRAGLGEQFSVLFVIRGRSGQGQASSEAGQFKGRPVNMLPGSKTSLLKGKDAADSILEPDCGTPSKDRPGPVVREHAALDVA